ncbi:MAG: hypothetical protein JRI97_13245, partial [Deltaproteobacteria bacterium]|nr:hypothetical protein [Deltaproteobacteria bacterium]
MPTKTLADIKPTPWKIIQKLAALAPKEEDATPPKPRPKKSDSRRSQDSDLGPLDLEKYLGHFGIEYSLKKDGKKALYRLRECLFDPSHRRNEAAIVQDASGLITYQCFHSSCSHTWSEARQKISGDANLAEFCRGYDPEKKKAPRSSKALGKELPAAFITNTGVVDWKTLFPQVPPPPEEVDPTIFYEKRSGRMMFIPLRMVYYLQAIHDGHVLFSEGEFWVYRRGLWKTCDPETLGQAIVHVLGEEARPNIINGSLEILKHTVAKEGTDWPTHERYINCLDGMVDVETGEVLPHGPEYYSRSQVPCRYGMKYYDKIDRWLQFLKEVWPEEQEQGKADV